MEDNSKWFIHQGRKYRSIGPYTRRFCEHCRVLRDTPHQQCTECARKLPLATFMRWSPIFLLKPRTWFQRSILTHEGEVYGV